MFRLMNLFAVLLFMVSALSCTNNATTDQAASEKPGETPKPAVTEQKQAPIAPALELKEDQLVQYVAIQETLAGDNFEGALAAAKIFEQSSEGAMKPLAATLAGAKDMTALRTHFLPISESIKDQPLPEGYVTVYCPMAFDNKGGHWLQKSGTLANPYYGAEMLTCGAVTRRGGAAAEKRAEE